MEVLALAPTKTGEPYYQGHRRRSTKVRRAPTLAKKLAKPWPMLASV